MSHRVAWIVLVLMVIMCYHFGHTRTSQHSRLRPRVRRGGSGNGGGGDDVQSTGQGKKGTCQPGYGAVDCSSCGTNHLMIASDVIKGQLQCVAICPITHYADAADERCVRCSHSLDDCAECRLSSDKLTVRCSSCDMMYLHKGSCVNDCPSGFKATDTASGIECKHAVKTACATVTCVVPAVIGGAVLLVLIVIALCVVCKRYWLHPDDAKRMNSDQQVTQHLRWSSYDNNIYAASTLPAQSETAPTPNVQPRFTIADLRRCKPQPELSLQDRLQCPVPLPHLSRNMATKTKGGTEARVSETKRIAEPASTKDGNQAPRQNSSLTDALVKPVHVVGSGLTADSNPPYVNGHRNPSYINGHIATAENPDNHEYLEIM